MKDTPQILIVEDESIVALDIQNRLRRLGYLAPAFVASGEAAIAKTAELQPDLILMDIKLRGDMDGIEAARRIRDEFGTPVVYLTAFADEATLQRAKETEPLGYLVKPFEERELLATVRIALYRHQAERRIRNSEHKTRSIIEQAMDGIFLIDTDGRVVEWNSAQAEITDIPPEEALGQYAWDIWERLVPEPLQPKLSASYLQTRIQQILATGRLPNHWRIAETEILRPDGERRTLQSRLFLIEGENGYMAGSVTRDVTESKRLDEAMRQAQMMESLGMLAGGAAHDFNNLLVAMLGQTSLALAKLPTEHPAATHIKKAVTAAERASELTRQMLAISGRGQFEKKALHLNHLIEDEYNLLRAIAPANIELILSLGDGLPLIEADARQTQQVLTNLVLNAIEAIGEQKGTIKISTAVHLVNESQQLEPGTVGVPLKQGRYIQLIVEDDGPGIDAQTKAKLFEPFFSTKQLGRGLGLPAVVGIIRGHQGAISVSSQPGQGTTFSVLFPESDAMLEDDPKEENTNWGTAVPPIKKSADMPYVLVIDDQEAVCEAVVDILDMENIPVIKALSGQEGIKKYQEHQKNIGLVLLDLSMPGMDGNETFKVLRQIDPESPIILSSGYDEQNVYHKFGEMGVLGFLQKPYNLTDLLATVKHHFRL